VPTQLVPAGWARLLVRASQAATIVAELLDDPVPLAAGLTATPQTFVHGDWKAGNLGSHPDGRTILLDWAVPGIAPGCIDLAWYVCLNRARLPESKEAATACSGC
jgi:aminoglycoside phosphotransferase (APT) family kinase protein